MELWPTAGLLRGESGAPPAWAAPSCPWLRPACQVLQHCELPCKQTVHVRLALGLV